ncbi:MAG: DUF2807 domain-containing protein [Cytophagales bacterium]|nr:DUF2807 domain-containing protein [Cytophagales bacterium]
MRSTELIYTMFFVVLFVTFGAIRMNREWEQADTGNVVRQTRPVPAFSRLHIDGVFEVHLRQGDTTALQIEAREGLMSRITTETEDGTLKLDLKRGLNMRKTTIKVYITVRDLEKLRIGGVASVKSDTPLRLGRLELEQHSVGTTQLALQCDRLTARITGVGTLQLTGSGREVEMHNTGVGAIKAADFETEVLRVENTGVGDVEVSARREISIHSSGVGSVRYKGPATVKEMHKSGIGSVRRM